MTAEVQTTLQKYYTKAIRSNQTVPEMCRAIMATLHHCNSTDDNPQHQFCPDGPSSWCFYKKHPMHEFSHKTEIGTPLSNLVFKAVKLYECMSSDDLLSRCVLQTTQNANESIHSVIWSRCSKTVFSTWSRFEIAVAIIVVGQFNFGSVSSQDFLRCLRLPVGEETKRLGKKEGPPQGS